MESLKLINGFAASSGGIGKRRHHQQLQRQALKCRSSAHHLARSSGGNLWERLQEAWGVLLGSSPSSRNGRRRVKQRFTRVLVGDRGFDADRLGHFYELAKAAISQHVVLEEGDEEGAARVESLGELQLQFRVRRIKSSAQEEPWARPTLAEYDPDSNLR